MTSIERTAYPRFKKYQPSLAQMESIYSPTPEEIDFIKNKLRKNISSTSTKTSIKFEQNFFNMALLLKCFQRLGYFPALENIPTWNINHIRNKLGLCESISPYYKHQRMLYRHQKIIRDFLNVNPYSSHGQKLAVQIAVNASQTLNYPADIINIVLEELLHHRFELPAFSTLARLAWRHSCCTDGIVSTSLVFWARTHAGFSWTTVTP